MPYIFSTIRNPGRTRQILARSKFGYFKILVLVRLHSWAELDVFIFSAVPALELSKLILWDPTRNSSQSTESTESRASFSSFKTVAALVLTLCV